MMAISSEDSVSSGRVSVPSMPHSSRNSSHQSANSSVSCDAPPSLAANSSSERARDASRTWAATDVPERKSCFPTTRTSSRVFGSLIQSRINSAANCFVRVLNSSVSLPLISAFPISVFYFRLSGSKSCPGPIHPSFPISAFYFLLFSNHVRKRTFHFPKIPDAGGAERDCNKN
jgi:hypothetical protein